MILPTWWRRWTDLPPLASEVLRLSAGDRGFQVRYARGPGGLENTQGEFASMARGVTARLRIRETWAPLGAMKEERSW
jgi:hypothetical protein